MEMVDKSLLPAIRETIKQNEIGSRTPYELSYALKGKSGASFGFMQGDTNAQSLARTTLTNVLSAAGASQTAITRIMTAVSRALPNGNPLSADDTKLANSALASAAGKKLVDAMDMQILSGVLSDVDVCIAAGLSRKVTIDPLALLYIAPWINMSGAPSLLKTWLAGAPALGLQPPSPPNVTAEEMETYLQATAYFQANPKNFVHYRECVALGAKLLP
jgi:hypothetical protein